MRKKSSTKTAGQEGGSRLHDEKYSVPIYSIVGRGGDKMNLRAVHTKNFVVFHVLYHIRVTNDQTMG